MLLKNAGLETDFISKSAMAYEFKKCTAFSPLLCSLIHNNKDGLALSPVIGAVNKMREKVWKEEKCAQYTVS